MVNILQQSHVNTINNSSNNNNCAHGLKMAQPILSTPIVLFAFCVTNQENANVIQPSFYCLNQSQQTGYGFFQGIKMFSI